MVDRPTMLKDEFAACGADVITTHAEVGESEATEPYFVRAAGLALRLDTPVIASKPYLDRIDALLLRGTAIGIKGHDLAPEACDRLASAASMPGDISKDAGPLLTVSIFLL